MKLTTSLVSACLVSLASMGCGSAPTLPTRFAQTTSVTPSDENVVLADTLDVVGGAQVNGRIARPYQLVRFPIVVDSLAKLIVFVDGVGRTDPTVALLDANEGQIAFDDDGGGSGNARLERVLDRGDYIIEVGTFAPSEEASGSEQRAAGPFRLSVWTEDPRQSRR